MRVAVVSHGSQDLGIYVQLSRLRPCHERSLLRIAILLVGIAAGIGSLKLGIPQVIAGYLIDYLSDGMTSVGKEQR